MSVAHRNKANRSFHLNLRSNLLNNQLKKEQLETEIQILENKANLKRQELKKSIASNASGYEHFHPQPVSLTNVKSYSMIYKNDNYKYDEVS
jgi:hypothetical protein